MSSLKEDIISHLKAKANYSPEVDDVEISSSSATFSTL